MQVPVQQLKSLSAVELTSDEQKIIKWMRSALWAAQIGSREPIPYRAKVPEFYEAVRLFRVQAGGQAGNVDALERLIKKLQFGGVISKQDLYPVTVQGTARFLSLKKADLENLGVGQDDSDDED